MIHLLSCQSRLFWSVSAELQQAVTAGATTEQEMLLAEIEGLARMTDFAAIRERCRALLACHRRASEESQTADRTPTGSDDLTIAENETKMYWEIMRDLRTAERAADIAEQESLHAELDAMTLCDSATLRRLVLKSLNLEMAEVVYMRAALLGEE